MRCYLAIDIGASFGRHIVGWHEGGEIRTEEVYRFPNGMTELDGHLTWDIDALLGHVKTGITIAKAKYPQIESPSVDTWGVDYVLLRGDKTETAKKVHAFRRALFFTGYLVYRCFSRYSRGVKPAYFLNTREKCAVEEKPR